MPQQPGLDAQNTLRLLEAEFTALDQQIRDQQATSAVNPAALIEKRDRLLKRFSDLKQQYFGDRQ